MKRLELYIDGKLEVTEELRKIYPGPKPRSVDADYYHRAYMKLARYGRASRKPYELYLIQPAKRWGPDSGGNVKDKRRYCEPMVFNELNYKRNYIKSL